MIKCGAKKLISEKKWQKKLFQNMNYKLAQIGNNELNYERSDTREKSQ